MVRFETDGAIYAKRGSQMRLPSRPSVHAPHPFGAPIYQKPKTSQKHPEHKIYPYLLNGLTITCPNQVWCTDITYIKMQRGFLYLVPIMDWHSRKVLSWRLSNTMDAGFYVEALKEATVKISMDGRGRWIDNRMIEQLWRSLRLSAGL